MEDDERAWAHTRAEWDQAWSQGRHLETMRGQWLGFFFTAVLGSVAIAGPRLDMNDGGSLVTAAALSLSLEVLSVALYLATVRLNVVARHYDQIIFAIRAHTIASPPAAIDLSEHRFPPLPPRGGRVGDVTTTKGISQAVLRLGIVIFVLLLAAVLARAATVTSVSSTIVVLCSVAFGGGLALAAFSVWAVKPPRTPAAAPQASTRNAAR